MDMKGLCLVLARIVVVIVTLFHACLRVNKLGVGFRADNVWVCHLSYRCFLFARKS